MLPHINNSEIRKINQVDYAELPEFRTVYTTGIVKFVDNMKITLQSVFNHTIINHDDNTGFYQTQVYCTNKQAELIRMFVTGYLYGRG